MTDLGKLIEAVEGGEGIVNTPVFDDMDKWVWEAYVNAMEGSLDAAKALHEALLPEWMWQVFSLTDCDYVSVVDGPEFSTEEIECPHNPARAWLIAVLKAYRAQQETEQ